MPRHNLGVTSRMYLRLALIERVLDLQQNDTNLGPTHSYFTAAERSLVFFLVCSSVFSLTVMRRLVLFVHTGNEKKRILLLGMLLTILVLHEPALSMIFQ